jgi:hypothetical protein
VSGVPPVPDPTPEDLRDEQAAREQRERQHLDEASTGGEERAALRRADKAAYLRDKLGEQAARDRD